MAARGLWAEIDEAVLNVLAERGGRLTPAEIAADLGMSEAAACSILCMLAIEDKVRIASVELIRTPVEAGARRARRSAPW